MDTTKFAKKIVEESIVLLKNEHNILPFSKDKKIAFFGRAQLNTYFSGNGSGATKSSQCLNIIEECEKRGIYAEPILKTFYQENISKEEPVEQLDFDFAKAKDLVNSGIMYELFGRYRAPEKEFEIPDGIIKTASGFTDTAVLVIGRNSGGEECDRHLNEDYYLTLSENQLVEQVCQYFEHVVLVLNINGLIDLTWTESCLKIKSILFLGICGEQGAAALADLLIGKVNPSGKLPVTIARSYEDYPSSKHFSWNKECPKEILTYESYGLSAEENGSVGFELSPVTVYWEDIYAGYRYFDTFNCIPLYPFGFGLSYTNFEIFDICSEKISTGLKVTYKILNIGKMAGKEVTQLYLLATGTKSERPYQELKGFEKTKLLNVGEFEETSITIPWKEFAIYEEERAIYVIERGRYQITIGNSSRTTKEVTYIYVENEIIMERCQNRLSLQACNKSKISFLSIQKESVKQLRNMEHVVIGTDYFILNKEDVNMKAQKSSIKDLSLHFNLQDFSIEELAALCVGYGPGTAFSAFGDGSDPDTIFNHDGKPITSNSHPFGVNGYVSPAIEKRSVYSVFYKDGPSGIGEIAWPSEMLIACAFDKNLWRLFGAAIGEECCRQQVNIWLAPAVNLHRNPLCGRNFEYFSEDPYLTGICASEITHGVQDNFPIIVCPKHFAINEQETYRRGNEKKNYDAADSIITERAARELYLKPFEMLVRENNILCIMSSFNKINGVFAGGNKELCTGILRDEWNFQGAVVTDWGDMDIVVNGADAVAAGNDIIMPGGPPVIKQILNGLRNGKVTRNELEIAVTHLLTMIEACT